MSGRAAIRGYLLQAMVCLLDSLKRDWVAVHFEPGDNLEKVDIHWCLADRKQRLVQVKSSERQFTVPDVKKWAQELERASSADEYELILLGPCSEGVTKMTTVGQVKLTGPLPLSSEVLLQQAAHMLDVLMWKSNKTPLGPEQRIQICESLIFTLLQRVTVRGAMIPKSEFLQLIESYTNVIEQKAEGGRTGPPITVGEVRNHHSGFLHVTLGQKKGAGQTILATPSTKKRRVHSEHFDYSVVFDLTNRGVLPARIEQLFVTVLEWTPYVDVKSVHPMAHLTEPRKFFCQIDSEPRRYFAALEEAGYHVIISPVEMDVIQLGINAATPGRYTIEVGVTISHEGQTTELIVGRFADVLFVGGLLDS